MNKPIILMILASLFAWRLFGAEIFVVNSESRTLSRIDLETGSVNNVFTQLGLTPNLLWVDSDYIYVALSGANSVQMIERSTGNTARTIFVASSANCWDVVKADEFLYVSGLFTDKVYKLSLQTYSVVAQLPVGVAPEGMVVHNNKLYVCNTGGYASNYANSSVSVIDLASFSVISTIPVWTNPQDLQVFGDQLHVVCTGNWSSISGAVEIIDSNTDTRIDRILVGGNPWSIWLSPSGTGYLGEGLNTGVYSYNASTLDLLHGSSNPLSPGAIAVHGSMDRLTLLSANWGQNGVVYLRDTQWQPIAQYTVALLPTDIWLAESGSEISDDLVNHPLLNLYPNPVSKQGILNVKLGDEANRSMEIYNLKGQKVLHTDIKKGETQLNMKLGNFSSGVYFYKLGKLQGRFLVY